jgi:phenylacetate-CoA oxygenase PaaJ subunit
VVVKAPEDIRERRVWEILADVPDPEIPTISVVDLGVIRSVVFEDDKLTVEMLPTFVGCPAIDVMRQQIGERLVEEDIASEVEVRVTFAEPWTSERITPAGRERLRASGFAPPEAGASVSVGSTSSVSCRWRPARTVGAATPRWRTRSGRRSAARSTTATTAASHSSSSRGSDTARGPRLADRALTHARIQTDGRTDRSATA